jgi:hypothetical protein
MNDAEVLDYILSCGIPICESIKTITQAPPELMPKLLGMYIKEMAEAIEPGGINNTKLIKYLTGSTGAIVGLMLAARTVRTAKK